MRLNAPYDSELRPPAAAEELGLPAGIRACLFDLDGVLTQTAQLHDAAWKETFDRFLQDPAARGRSRSSHSTLSSTTSDTWTGDPGATASASSSPRAASMSTTETVTVLGDRKNELVLELIRRQGLAPYEGSVRYVRAVREAGLRRAVVSASANCRAALEAAGLTDLFEVRIDAARAEEEHLPGKPAPDTFLAAARELDVEPADAAVFEDALAGVAAGRAGRFGFVVGVDRTGHADASAEREPTSLSPT